MWGELMDDGASSYSRYLNGDDSGFVEIVRDYKDGLILYLNSFTGNFQIAEELAEDTFVKLGLKKPKNLAKASFKTWLYAIGRNTAIDYFRKSKKRYEVAIDDCIALSDGEEIEKAYIKQENKLLLYKAIGSLKPEYRQVLWLIYFESFTYKQAAKIMKKSVHATETLAYRARLALKAELNKEDFDYENL